MVYGEIITDPKIDPDKLDEKNWQSIPNGELGVPCFNTNPSNPNWPRWRIEPLRAGTYLFRGEARPSEASGNWNDQSVKREYRQYNLTKP